MVMTEAQTKLLEAQQAANTTLMAAAREASVIAAYAQADAANADVVASKAEMTEMKGELSEKVFNATLKFDIAQRHQRRGHRSRVALLPHFWAKVLASFESLK